MKSVKKLISARSLFSLTIMAVSAFVLVLGFQITPAEAQTTIAKPDPRYCDDSQHDPTAWHPAVDPVTGCWYGHEHGSDPNPPGSPFTPLVFSGDEATPNENLYKHNGYKVFYIHRSNPNSAAPTADPCDDVRVRIHMDVTPRERTGQYHSFEAAVAHCANGQIDVSYIQGWADFGTVVNLSTRVGGDNGVRPNKFAPNTAEWQQHGANIWEVWYGRTGVGLDMGWLAGEVPTVAHDGADPNNMATWQWTGNKGGKRKIENFNFYGWRETRRGEFFTDPYGNSVDPNSAYCQQNQCMRQYVSPLFGKARTDQIIFNLQYDNAYDTTGINFPTTFPVEGPHLPWWGGVTNPPPTNTPVPTPTPQPEPTGPAVKVTANPHAANVGDLISVSLDVVNVTDLYGLQATCQVDPAVLAGTTAAAGAAFGDSSQHFFIDKAYTAADGKWTVAASRLQPNPAISGNGTAFTLGYTVQSAASTPITCSVLGVDANGDEVALSVVNASFNGATTPPPVEETPPPTEEPTLPPPAETPVPGALTTIAGTAAYQNAPDNAGINVALKSGDTVLATITTNANGAYSFTDVPMGSYSLEVSATLHLTVTHAVSVDADGQVINVEVYTLPAGDTNDNAAINLEDAAWIGINFGSTTTPTADLNRDAQVDIRDLVLIGGNFGMTGPVVK